MENDLTPHQRWILRVGGEIAGRELGPDDGLGRMLLELDRRIGPEGGGLSSRQVIGLAVMIWLANNQPQERGHETAQGDYGQGPQGPSAG